MVNRPVSDSERIDIQHISQAGMTEGSQLKNWPHTRRAGRGLRKADCSRLVDSRFHKQENLHMRLVLDFCKMTRFPHPPATIFKIYTEALTGFSHIYHPDGLNTLLSQACVLENGSSCGNSGLNAHSKERDGSEGPPVAHTLLPGQIAVTSFQ